MSAIVQAKHLYERGYAFIPLIKNTKKNLDKDIYERIYTIDEVNEDNNLGINLEKSNIVDVDLDDDWAIKFGTAWLPDDTMRLGRRYTNGKVECTHYFFKKVGDPKEAHNKVAELRLKGQTVVYGSTQHKQTGETFERYWFNSTEPKEISNLREIFFKISFASFLAPHINKRFQLDHVGLKIDGCLKRYTNYSDDEREKFLTDFYSVVSPSNKIKPQDYKRQIKSNNNETKVAGFKSLAETLELEPKEVKKWCNWIGQVPEKETNIKKTIISFASKALTGEQLKKRVVRKDLIEDLFPDHGLLIIAGRPKSMKSFCALDLAYSVQNKFIETFYGKKILEHGDVLGLFLEDDADSMALRIQGMNFIDLDKPTTFVEDCPQITRGLEESIEMWCEEVSNPKLVIIDTFQKIKPLYTKGGQNANAYEIDYHYLSILKRVADKHKLLIIYIHHLKQAKVDYKWDRIMGSTGHQGVTDGMYMIDRDELGSNATFMGRGRNIRDFQYQLIWNDENLRYENTMAAPTIVVANETKREVFKAMKILKEKYNKHSVKPADIYEILALEPKSLEARNIQKTMQRMRAPGDDQELSLGAGFGTYSLKVASEHIDEEGNLIKRFDNIV